MVDPRKRVQEILDDIETGWVLGPLDAEHPDWYDFQKLDGSKRGGANIPRRWIDDGEDDWITLVVRAALAKAKVL